MNREDAPHLSDDRFNDLILALGTLREAIKNLNEKNEQLTSGPGGIMELKQTIADKEAELEEDLADHNELVVQTVHMDLHIAKLETEIEKLKSGPGGIMEMKQTIADKESHIEKLETALEHTMECYLSAEAALKECVIERDEARKALEGKDD